MTLMRTEASPRASIPKAMLAFVGPFMLSILVQNLYGAVDLFVVGHYVTTADVSAVTIGSQVMNMVTQLTLGLATGTTVLMGKTFGAGNVPGMRKTVGTAAVLFCGFGVVLAGALFALTPSIVGLMQTPAGAVEAARAYLSICSIGALFIVGYNVIASILMGMGDTRTPFLFVCVACVINIVMDLVLVRGFGMGAMGAAIATASAQAGSVLFSLLYLRRRGLGFAFSKTDLRIDGATCRQTLKTGAPVAVQNAMVSLSFLFITAVINGMGLVASASVGIVEKSITFLMVPAIAFGASVATISAQNLGAGEPARARQALRYGVVLSLVPSIILVVFCQFAGQFVTGLFTAEAAVIATGADYLRSYVWDVVLVCFVFSFNGYLNSSGYAWFTLLHSLLTTFLIRVPVSFLLSRIPGVSIYLIGWAAPVSTLVSIVMCLLFLRRTHRRQGSLQLQA